MSPDTTRLDCCCSTRSWSPCWAGYQSSLTAIGHLPRFYEREPAKVAERQREKEVIKRRLAVLTEESPPGREFVEQTIAFLNGKPGDPHSFDLLDRLLDNQAYRLSYWRVASDRIKYRRFFGINGLAGLRMARPGVFAGTRGLTFGLFLVRPGNGPVAAHPGRS